MTDESVPGPGRLPEGGRPTATLFEAVGGRPFFDRLVDRFYDGVEADPRLRPLYPEDLTDSRAHLAGFLAQYWGGGTVQYSDARGHPRLRMRHAPFAVGPGEAKAWYEHMEAAVRSEALPDDVAEVMLEYFATAAGHMINTP